MLTSFPGVAMAENSGSRKWQRGHQRSSRRTPIGVFSSLFSPFPLVVEFCHIFGTNTDMISSPPIT